MTTEAGRLFISLCVLCASAQVGPVWALADQARPVNQDALVLQDFKTRVDEYLKLRNQLRKGAPPLKETKHPAEITAASEALATKLRAARREAQPGDIFTPAIRAKFRQLMSPDVTGPERRETKATLQDEPLPRVSLKVNALYPETAPLPTVPANILADLPQLPEALEYRFVGRHLILRDVDANIIVDYIPNAIR